MGRSYAAVPHEYLEEMAELNDEEFGRLMRALLQYSMTAEVVELPGNERFYYRRVINQENRHQQSYESIAARNRENGKKGGRPKKEEGETQKTETKNKTDTKNKNKNKNNTLSSTDEKSSAMEQIRRDMEALAALERKEREAHEQTESGLVGVCQAYDPAVSGPGQ